MWNKRAAFRRFILLDGNGRRIFCGRGFYLPGKNRRVAPARSPSRQGSHAVSNSGRPSNMSALGLIVSLILQRTYVITG
jgi:hypothetical protein